MPNMISCAGAESLVEIPGDVGYIDGHVVRIVTASKKEINAYRAGIFMLVGINVIALR